ncbi:MAG: hemerythrin family protein [Limnochordales bacterium]|nr:hemerythrin family protein [Limnochordales bacterium]
MRKMVEWRRHRLLELTDSVYRYATEKQQTGNGASTRGGLGSVPLVTWDETYSVHVDTLDRQHQKLFDLINELHSAMASGRGREVVGEVLAGLVEYTRVHFTTEGNYMLKYGYPGYNDHKVQHDYFISKLDNFRQDFTQGKLNVSIKLLIFLSDWLVSHIKGSDKAYSRYFQEKGLHV